MLGAIPVYHPIYADVESELIGLVDDHFAHGNMRNWAAFTAPCRSSNARWA